MPLRRGEIGRLMENSILVFWILPLSRNFPDHQDTFQIIRKLSRLSKFQTLSKFSRLSRNFLDHLGNIHTNQKLSTDYLETFKALWKFSSLSKNFLGHLENIQTIQKFSRRSRNFPVQFQGLCAKTFQMTMPTRFLALWRRLPAPKCGDIWFTDKSIFRSARNSSTTFGWSLRPPAR